ALVADEYGTIQGLVTPIDILEAIAGEFPDEDEQPSIQALDEGYWRVSGATDLHHLEQELGTGSLFDDDIDVSSIAGLVLARLDSLPEPGSRVEIDGFEFEVAELQGRRITQLRVRKLPDDDMAA